MKTLWKKFIAWLMGQAGDWLEPHKPRNQWKHFVAWGIVGIPFAGIHSFIWKTGLGTVQEFFLWYWAFAVVAMLSLLIELNQARGVKTPLEYWKNKWLDSLLDIVASVAGFMFATLPWLWGWIGWTF